MNPLYENIKNLNIYYVMIFKIRQSQELIEKH